MLARSNLHALSFNIFWRIGPFLSCHSLYKQNDVILCWIVFAEAERPQPTCIHIEARQGKVKQREAKQGEGVERQTACQPPAAGRGGVLTLGRC